MKLLSSTLFFALALCPWDALAQDPPGPEEPPPPGLVDTEAVVMPSDLTAAEQRRLEQCKDRLTPRHLREFASLPQPKRRDWLNRNCAPLEPSKFARPAGSEPPVVQAAPQPPSWLGPIHEPDSMPLSRVMAHSMFWPGSGLLLTGFMNCALNSDFCEKEPGHTMGPFLISGGVLILGGVVAAIIYNKRDKRQPGIALMPMREGLAGAWTVGF